MTKYLKYSHPFLLAIFPVLFLYEHNKDLADPSYLTKPILLTLGFAVVVFFAFSKILKTKEKAAVASSAFIILVSSFGHFLNAMYDYFNQVYNLFISSNINAVYLIVLFVWFIILGVILVLIKEAKGSLTNLNQYLNIFATVLVVFSLYSIMVFNYQSKVAEPIEIGDNNLGFDVSSISRENLPDIYYLIFDSYGRADILDEYYDFDNSDIVDYLQTKGFYVATESRANYPKTFLSIPSALNMTYVHEAIANFSDDDLAKAKNSVMWQDKLGLRYRARLKDAIYDNKVVNFLDKLGYDLVTVLTPWVGVYNNQKFDTKLDLKLNANDFDLMLLDTLVGFQVSALDNEARNQFLFSVAEIPKLAELENSTFIYAHFMPPHNPFLFAADGSPVDSLGKNDVWSEMVLYGGEEIKNQYAYKYIEQVEYVNANIKKIVDQILENSAEEPVIIIQSDHGPNLNSYIVDQTDDGIKERLSIFNAYYFPGQDYEQLYAKISPVNSFRAAFNAIFGLDLELLEDRNYHSGYQNEYIIKDVTEQYRQAFTK